MNKILFFISLFFLSQCVSIDDIKDNKVHQTWKTSKSVKTLFSCFQEKMEVHSGFDYKVRYYDEDRKGTFSINNATFLSSDYLAVFTYEDKKIKVQLDWGLFFKDKLIKELNFKTCL